MLGAQCHWLIALQARHEAGRHCEAAEVDTPVPFPAPGRHPAQLQDLDHPVSIAWRLAAVVSDLARSPRFFRNHGARPRVQTDPYIWQSLPVSGLPPGFAVMRRHVPLRFWARQPLAVSDPEASMTSSAQRGGRQPKIGHVAAAP